MRVNVNFEKKFTSCFSVYEICVLLTETDAVFRINEYLTRYFPRVYRFCVKK